MCLLTYYFNSILLMTSSTHHYFCYRTLFCHIYQVICVRIDGEYAVMDMLPFVSHAQSTSMPPGMIKTSVPGMTKFDNHVQGKTMNIAATRSSTSSVLY